jgi:ABC-type branched-subunit amino acid transport system substrate-binding protein|uniref:Holin n=1 Tax=viral metagenome TaxID=1070528 RepID=A0A6C0LWA2_9ZZZZ
MDRLQKELSELQSAFDLQEVVKRAVKYLIEGGAVAVAAYYIPKKKMNIEEIVMIAITAAATFALLDMYAPSISNAARQGTGFGIGANLAGFPQM